eukprot:6205891-Pleurochrysis_carterae.AAC.1
MMLARGDADDVGWLVGFVGNPRNCAKFKLTSGKLVHVALTWGQVKAGGAPGQPCLIVLEMVMTLVYPHERYRTIDWQINAAPTAAMQYLHLSVDHFTYRLLYMHERYTLVYNARALHFCYSGGTYRTIVPTLLAIRMASDACVLFQLCRFGQTSPYFHLAIKL